jgi:hypothetical protein
MIVPDVGCPAELVVFEDEQDVPLQLAPHVCHQASGYVGIGINPGARREPLGMLGEF